MSIGPSKRAVDVAARKKIRTEHITRVIALIIAFVSVFIFFVKLLFL